MNGLTEAVLTRRLRAVSLLVLRRRLIVGEPGDEGVFGVVDVLGELPARRARRPNRLLGRGS